MTYFLQDILRQPHELRAALDYLCGDGRPALDRAAGAIRKARHVYLTGLGSSWHVGLDAQPLFHRGGSPVYAQDAAELLHFSTLPERSALIVVSRSGRSAEIVKLLLKARDAKAIIVGVTNSMESPLAQQAQAPLVIPTVLDHGISVNTYSTLALAAGALACAAMGSFDLSLAAVLRRAIDETEAALATWRELTVDATWLAPRLNYYFLARSSSLGSCHEARLLWEEAVKSPATALGMGNFRHGPQEIVAQGTRFGVWIDGQQMREQDLAVAQDLRRLGASVMLIGQDLPKQGGDLVFQLPRILPEWQFLIDIIPAQLAAERLSQLAGVDCDCFRICPYIIEDESGLLPPVVSAPTTQ